MFVGWVVMGELVQVEVGVCRFPVHFVPQGAVRLLYTSTSRNGKWPSSSISMVNLILLCNPFRWCRNSVSLSRPWGQMVKVSSTYLYQHVGLCVASSIAFFSKSSMKKLAMTGERGEPMATPSVCSQIWSSQQKYVEVSTCLNSARMLSSKC